MHTTLIDAASTVLAADVNLDGIKTLVIRVLGTALLIVLLVRMFNAYTKRQWGEMVGEIVAVLLIGFFVWTPDTAVQMLKDLTSSIFS